MDRWYGPLVWTASKPLVASDVMENILFRIQSSIVHKI